MRVFLVMNKRALLMFLGSVFAFGLLVGLGRSGREQPIPIHIPVTSHTQWPLFYVKTEERAVALTFDISWGTKTLPLVLPILREHGVKATFFLSGPWAKRYPNLVQEIVRDGHEIASHGDRHVNLSQYDRAAIAENISKAHADLREVSGKTAQFFRPPNGDYDDLVIQTAKDLGYETVIWSVDSLDWKNPGVDFMIHRVLTKTAPGGIILMHASDSCKQTHLALPGIIEGLRKQGYQIGTLGELMPRGTPGRNDPR